jgi:hypothetical protein
LGAPKDANRPAVVTPLCKGIVNKSAMGLVTVEEHFNYLVNTLWGHFELDIGRFGS